MKKRLIVAYGDDPYAMVPTLLSEIDAAALIPRGARIGIKPNLVVSKPSASGATTDPRVVGAIIAYLQERNFHDIRVMESSWIGDCTQRAFDVCGYRALAGRFGVPLIDLKDAPVRRMRGGGLEIDICAPILDIDFLINVPVLKVHSQTKLTCALKNLKGGIPDLEKQRFHSLGLHRPIAALSTIVRSDLVVVDGIVGDLSHEEGGNPVRMDRIIVGLDPVMVDSYAARLLGYRAAEIDYIGLAERLGVGTRMNGAVDVVQLNSPTPTPFDTHARPISERFGALIDARDACSPCYASLLHALHRLERAGKLPQMTFSIGQGFKNHALACGIGNCTKKGDCYLKGCPPTAEEIIRFVYSLS